MRQRSQQGIRRPVEVTGIGFLTGADVTLRFLPAAPNHGIAFQRTDCIGSAAIPARIEYTVPRKRRTAIAHQGVTVELTEVFCGTDLKVMQEGVPDAIPEAACYLGWQESLLQLANLVEPDIKQ